MGVWWRDLCPHLGEHEFAGTRSFRWFVALIGVWLMITVITIDVGAASKWNDLVVGFVVFISSAVLWEMVPYMGRPRSVKN